ncbi:hypothetical protein ACTFIT_003205 [Dictyostelium discoideum]
MKYKIRLLIFYVFSLFCFVNCQTKYNIINANPSEINLYPSPISQSSCSFKIILLVVNVLDQTGPPPSITINIDENNQIESKPINQNETSALYFEIFSRMDGSYPINVTIPNDSNSLLINFTCDYADVSKLSVSFIDELSFNEVSLFSTVFKINGLLRPLSFENSDPSFSIVQLPNTDLYRIQFSHSFIILQTTSNWLVETPFMNGQTFSFYVTYKNGISPTINLEEIIDLTFYPDQSAVVTMPVAYSQIIKFKLITNLTTTTNQPYFNLYNNGFNLAVRPILGSLGNITYISSCYYSSSTKQHSLYHQNGQPSFIGDIQFDTTQSYDTGSTVQVRVEPVIMDNNKTITFYTGNLLNRLKYDFKPITYSSNSDYDTFSDGFPFGFINGNNLNYNLTYSIKTFKDLYPSIDIHVSTLSGSSSRSIIPFNQLAFNQSELPNVVDIQSIYLGEFKFLIQFKIKVNGLYPINTIKININEPSSQEIQTLVLKPINIISGSLFDGIWETIHDGVKYGKGNLNNPLQIFSFSGMSKILNIQDPFSIESPTKTFELPFIKLNNNQNNILKDLVNVTFLYDTIDVTNQVGSNILYFNFTNSDNYKNLPIAFSLIDAKTLSDNNFDLSLNSDNDKLSDNWVFAEWVNNRFQVKFKIPSNTMPGIINYFLVFTKEIKVFSSSLPQSSQLNIVSNNIDIYGPIFSKIIKNPPNLESDSLGWLITIEDSINGFRDGYITVRGVVDSSLYNFTIDPTKSISGDKWSGDYEIYIKENQVRCVPQSYEIVEVVLFDTFNNKASYIKFTENNLENTKFNPFINYLNDITIVTVSPPSLICNSAVDYTAPIITSFTSSVESLDVGSLNGRSVTFEFECQDNESGIRLNQFPIIYLTTLNLEIHKCISTNSTPFQTNTKFTCTTTVSLGFGFPSEIIISVYGLINNGGYYGGYSTLSLKELGFDYYIKTITQFTEDQPIIQSTNTITNQGGKLMIYGRKLNCDGSGSVNVLLKYLDDGLDNFISFTPKTIYDSFILIENIRPTNQSFIIKISNSLIESNEFKVTPILFYFNIPIEPTNSPTETPTPTTTTTPTPTPTTSLLPTVSPIPTNPPQKCQGNPECGGPNQGTCKDGGCVCFSPFIGLTCTSQVIVVPPPTINTTDPSTEVTIPPPNNENIIFKSLISLVSLRELDFNGKEIQVFNFEKWIYTPLGNNKYLYETSISNEITTNIITTIEWFNSSEIIEFANQKLEMNPSSVKYTIEISKYSFKSSLNTLQLVMSAKLTSNTQDDDICSSKQFGNTTNGDDSNFLKIQVDNYSVYGRFIKRAIIDEKVQSIENLQLDQSMNPISKSYSTQSFIGITIPQYLNSLIIDPDFSILVDQKAASTNSENSICSNNNNSSSLSGGQIAGIVIGSVAFLAVLITYALNWEEKLTISDSDSSDSDPDTPIQGLIPEN